MTSMLATADGAGTPPDATDAHGLMLVVGADDAFVLARANSGRWENRGGVGRGAAWTGGVDFELARTPLLVAALEDDQGIARLPADPTGRHRHVIGPYFATAAAIIALSVDLVVVFGRRADPQLASAAARGDRAEVRFLLEERPDVELRAIAGALVAATPAAPAAKALAQELQVLHAVQAMTRSLDLAFQPALEHLVAVASGDLEASYVIAVTAAGEYATAERTWAPTTSTQHAAATISALFHRRSRTVCVQDAEQSPLPEPFGSSTGIRSYLAVPIAQPVGGILLAVHADPAARGFTALNRRIADQLLEAASVLLQVADLRRDLMNQAERSAHEARHDALTGVANRLAWDEAIAEAQRSIDLGGTVSLVIADLNGLKATNDRFGHAAGDHLIAALAETLRTAIRGNDLVARLGGDEFGVLLPGLGESDAVHALDRLKRALSDVRTDDELPVMAAFGLASCPPFGSLTETWRDADQVMYAEKRKHHARLRARRAALGPRSS